MFKGRTYADFKRLGISSADFVEMDTVISASGSQKCILTVCFPDTGLGGGNGSNEYQPAFPYLVFIYKADGYFGHVLPVRFNALLRNACLRCYIGDFLHFYVSCDFDIRLHVLMI